MEFDNLYLMHFLNLKRRWPLGRCNMRRSVFLDSDELLMPFSGEILYEPLQEMTNLTSEKCDEQYCHSIWARKCNYQRCIFFTSLTYYLGHIFSFDFHLWLRKHMKTWWAAAQSSWELEIVVSSFWSRVYWLNMWHIEALNFGCLNYTILKVEFFLKQC